METKTKVVRDYAGQLKLMAIQGHLEKIIKKADEEKCSYLDFLLNTLQTEINHRYNRNLEKRIKAAKLPVNYDLDNYDYSFVNGISKQQLKQLRECMWLEKIFNIVLMGPSGTGKTLIAAGLCYDALKSGYIAYFRTMEQINEILIMKDITRSALIEYNKLLKAHLLVIDDIMMFALEKKQAVQLFNFINHLHEKASFIITTNKSPEEWVKMLDDEVIATALLDRILYRCEVVRLQGKSYRLENRKTIFN
jgi:DNA replication protein DnaC